MIKTLRPGCLVNSRIKAYYAEEALPLVDCDYLSMDDNQISREFLDVPWENPGTMNTSYGYNKNDQNWHPAERLIRYLVDITSKGGNYLLNVGPTDRGIIQKASADRLLALGEWMDVNGEAIYHTVNWEVFGEGPVYDRYIRDREEEALHTGSEEEEELEEELEEEIEESHQDDVVYTAQDIRFTKKGNTLYAICLGWPAAGVTLQALNEITNYKINDVSMLGSEETIRWEQHKYGLMLSAPEEKPCDHAYVYKIVLQE
jgi:alpha-L-fucosidase